MLVLGLETSCDETGVALYDTERGLLAQALGQAGEIAVAGDQAEAVEPAAVEQVHGIDDHGRVRCIFPRRIAVLLDGRDGVLQQYALPTGSGRFCPVAIDAFEGRCPVFGDLLHHPFYVGIWDVVSIDQDGKFELIGSVRWHSIGFYSYKLIIDYECMR